MAGREIRTLAALADDDGAQIRLDLAHGLQKVALAQVRHHGSGAVSLEDLLGILQNRATLGLARRVRVSSAAESSAKRALRAPRVKAPDRFCPAPVSRRPRTCMTSTEALSRPATQAVW